MVLKTVFGDWTDNSRMQTADVDRNSTCSCCHSPLIAYQWISDDYRDDEVKSSNDSRLRRDSVADWHQQNVWEDVQPQITPFEQYSQAAAVSDCDSTLVGLLVLITTLRQCFSRTLQLHCKVRLLS